MIVSVLAMILLANVCIPENGFAQQIIYKDTQIQQASRSISVKNISGTIDTLVSFTTRHNLSIRNKPDFGIDAAAGFIKKSLDRFSKSGVAIADAERIEYRAGGKNTRLGKEITLENIIYTVHGTDKGDNRVIALLAHYDSRSFDNSDSLIFAPGANDNGSGVSALLEIARVLSINPLPVTVKIMFLSGEEHGLLGAAHMAALAKTQGWNLAAVLNNDMIGNSRSSATEISNNTKLRIFSENVPVIETESMRKERVFNSAENDSKSRQLARYIKEIGERYVENLEIKLIYRNDRFGRGGDHTPFAREGFTSVRLCEYHENYDRTHQVVELVNGAEMGDVKKGVDLEYVRKNAAVNLVSVMNMALAPAAPSNVKIDISGLSSSTQLSWSAPEAGKKPAGYYVLVRETDKSNWERKIFVKETSCEIDISKDNYLFAVQSVDSDGHESIAVFATGGNLR